MTIDSDRYAGCLLCGAIGDALGAKHEWQSHRTLLVEYPKPLDLFTNTDLSAEFYYSDDTQSTIATCEAILSDGGLLTQAALMQSLADNYDAWRGYGLGFRKIISAYLDDVPISELARIYFTDGSYGNGAAMRIAPVALTYLESRSGLDEAVQLASSLTHCHPLAIEGARILAHGIQAMLTTDALDRDSFFEILLRHASSSEYIEPLQQARSVRSIDDLLSLGSDIAAHQSVPAACAAFSLHSTDLTACIGDAVRIGGDTDTVASMAGNLFGALNGSSQIPRPMLVALDRDNPKKGATYLTRLALRLYANAHNASN